MFNKKDIIVNAVPVKLFASNLGLYDNFYRNINELKSGFKIKQVGNNFFVLLPDWFIKLLEIGYDCYVIKPYDDFKYEFKVELSKKTEIGFYKNDNL
ncbi:hypothetical protein ACH17H_000577 [Campylobacter coli]|nr:hypothetical protein [Campylobacter jejuni]EHD2739960.1 hypothetical protein [Campylobacter jejuni]ELO9362985.1 hypothetical protein [Campylobacter jejuni]HAN0562146.1 hypothetical protein [Campylobacter jejuni]HAN0623552.1 hypothetical protein [Campylobacter jejuni]